MKKLVDGITYNTETAELIAKHRNRFVGDDEERHVADVYEILYRTKKGRYFLYVDKSSGIPRTRLATGIRWSLHHFKSQEIIPLTDVVTFYWFLEIGLYEEAEKHFVNMFRDYIEKKKNNEPDLKAKCSIHLVKVRNMLSKYFKVESLRPSKDMGYVYLVIGDCPYSFGFSIEYNYNNYSGLEKFANDVSRNNLLSDIEQLAEDNLGEYIFLDQYKITLVTKPV